MNTTTMKKTTIRRPLLIVAAIVVAVGIGLYALDSWRTTRVVHESISQPLGAATNANITIAMGIGQLRISALDQPGDLIAGAIFYPEPNRVDRAFAIHGDMASFTLREQDSQGNSLIQHRENDALWDLRLAPATPLRLTIEAGVGESTLDLGQLKLTNLDLKTGIGSTTFTLPSAGQLQAHIEGGVGETTIRIPQGVAARITLNTGITDLRVRGNFEREGDTFVSPNFDSAANRVDLTTSSGIGTIAIQQIGV